jgi:hypothetical protein
MGRFTRVSDTEAAYISYEGIPYRLLALTGNDIGTWTITPDVTPPQPVFCAVPWQPDIFGDFEIRWGDEVIGHAMSLDGAAMAVEGYLAGQDADQR